MADLLSYLQAGKPDSYVTGLDPIFSGRLQQMFSAMPPGMKAQVMSGFRSPQRQAEIMTDSLRKRVGPQAAEHWQGILNQYGQDPINAANAADAWLRSTGITKWVAPPGKSEHQKKLAVDLSYGSPEATNWFHQNAAKYGLTFPLSNENWHIEPTDARGFRMPPETDTAAGATTPATPTPPGKPAGTGLGGPPALGDMFAGAASSLGSGMSPAASDPTALAALFQPTGYKVPDTAQGATQVAQNAQQLGGNGVGLDQLFNALSGQSQLAAQKAQMLLPGQMPLPGQQPNVLPGQMPPLPV